MSGQKIVPHIWFVDRAEEAVKLYTSLLPDSEIGKIQRYDAQTSKVAGQPEGSVMSIYFMLAGQEYGAIQGGEQDFLGEGFGKVSLLVKCQDQAEIDKLWEALGKGGQEWPCGWLVDKYGVTWQIVPHNIDELLKDSPKAWQAMVKMKRIDLAALEAAAKK